MGIIKNLLDVEYFLLDELHGVGRWLVGFSQMKVVTSMFIIVEHYVKIYGDNLSVLQGDDEHRFKKGLWICEIGLESSWHAREDF